MQNFIALGKKIYDMTPIIARGKVFAKLNDDDFFMRAHSNGTTVVWDDTLDIAPEELYENGVELT